MNVLNSKDDKAYLETTQSNLLYRGAEELQAFAKSAQRLQVALEQLKELGDQNVARRADKMYRQLQNFEPSVTMIGQIKSGKTSLVNALIGAPNLLPADVNPWTSVVTSLHLNPVAEGFENRASFQFFDSDEWQKLISGGGRIGELASRAGADDELEKIKQQVIEMREKTRKRLGRKFEVLLGQKREYGYFDKDLIERYVCLGEEPEADNNTFDSQGRFADITKAADIYLTRAALPLRLCIRDTPGVNDTFMMREQITIRAIRDSRICVVTLSAHQALSSTDLALIRLISHVKSRDVILFVNRIDELSDPIAQIDQIRESILATLQRHKGPQNAQIIFGSAIWASHALQNKVSALPPHAAASLAICMKASRDAETEHESCTSLEEVWFWSGVPELQSALAARICNGDGAALLQRIGASGGNLVDGLSAADTILTDQSTAENLDKLTVPEAYEVMRSTTSVATEHLQADLEVIKADFAQRLERVQDSFLERATASLVLHLERYGEETPWTYDPAGLRVLLASSHKVLTRKTTAAFEKATKNAVQEIAEVYQRSFSISADDIHIAPPRAPAAPAPVSLGQTIALDLSSSWWKRWWLQKRGYEAYAASFFDLIKSETNPLIAELRDDIAQNLIVESYTDFESFLKEQLSIFETLCQRQQVGGGDIHAALVDVSSGSRQDKLRETKAIFQEFAYV